MTKLQICYHGTGSEGAKGILKNGFRPYSYFALNLQDALGFGGEHIFEVAFPASEVDDFDWQFKAQGRVLPDRIVCHFTLNKRVLQESERLRKKVFNSNKGNGR